MDFIELILHVVIIGTGVNIARKHSRDKTIELVIWIISTYGAGVIISTITMKLVFLDLNSSVIQLTGKLFALAIMYSMLYVVFNLRFDISDAKMRLKILGAHFVFVIVVFLIRAV